MTEHVYPTDHPVMVTGATGFVAGWLVRRLLEEGLTVHAPVREPSNAEKTAHLDRMAAELPGELKLFEADLLDDGSYGPAMEGCAVVFHTASPFTSNFDDPQRDLVDPAVNGTRNVLETANRTPSVQRVVVTSSCAAIYGDNKDVQHAPGKVLTEDIWNTTSSLDRQPYSYSKVEAEKAAWAIADAQSRWRLVTINPSLVIGQDHFRQLDVGIAHHSQAVRRRHPEGGRTADGNRHGGCARRRRSAFAGRLPGRCKGPSHRLGADRVVSRTGSDAAAAFRRRMAISDPRAAEVAALADRADGQQAAVASDDFRQHGIPLAGGQFQVEARARHRVPSGQRRGGGDVCRGRIPVWRFLPADASGASNPISIISKGVKETVSGYIGGKMDNPNYQNHTANGDREAVRIIYDPIGCQL
jgi:nucleoside-diphosphate-sugar epimerase